MPWQHCDVPFILDDEVCPTCGQDKASWTVELDRTRTLVIGLPKKSKALIDIELRDPGAALRPGRPYRAEFASGLVKTGHLDEKARARFEQLAPGPCQVTFPEEPLEAGTRFALAKPLADVVRARPAPLPLWTLQRVAKVQDPQLQAQVAATLVPPPPEEEPPQEGEPLKVDLPLRVTFASAAEGQAWVAANRLQVHVDGEPTACGAFVGKDAGDPARLVVHVQFKVPPGSHHVLVSSHTEARGVALRTVLLSQRLEVEGDAPASDSTREGGPTAAPLALAAPMTLARAPEKAPAARSGAKPGAARASSAKGRSAARPARPNPYAAHAASGEKLVAAEFAPDPIGLTKPQLDRGAGELYVFQPPAAGLKVDLPLQVTFATAADAQRWLLENKLQVHVDGQAAPCGAFVKKNDQVYVQFKLEPGDHQVLVSTRTVARGTELRTVLLSQRLSVESDAAAEQAREAGRAANGREGEKPSASAKPQAAAGPKLALKDTKLRRAPGT